MGHRLQAVPARARTIGEGQKVTTEGIVVNRDVDTFTIRDSRGKETIVGFTAKTKFRLVRKGLFRADRSSDASEIRRGLRLKVEGIANSDARLRPGTFASTKRI